MADIDLIRQAITANLKARLALENERQQKLASTDLKLHWIDFSKDKQTLQLESIINNAAKTALQKQMNMLGKMLFDATQSTDKMRDLAEAIAGDFNWGWAIDIMDKNWDGIGTEQDMWIA